MKDQWDLIIDLKTLIVILDFFLIFQLMLIYHHLKNILLLNL